MSPAPSARSRSSAVAIAEFARVGYARASVVEIAVHAGISKPLIYQYFGSKDGLFLACLHHVAGGLLRRLEDAELAVDDSVESRIYPLRAVFDALEPQRDAWRLLFDTTTPADGADPGRGRRLPGPHHRASRPAVPSGSCAPAASTTPPTRPR